MKFNLICESGVLLSNFNYTRVSDLIDFIADPLKLTVIAHLKF